MESYLLEHIKLRHPSRNESREVRVLSKKLMAKIKIHSLNSSLANLFNGVRVDGDIAKRFIRKSAWWFSHPSGKVRAPGDSDYVELNPIHGWIKPFGANKFLVEKAIVRCHGILSIYINNVNPTQKLDINQLKRDLTIAICGSVANYANEEYDVYLALNGDDLMFGTHSINVDDFITLLFEYVPIQTL